MWKNIVKESDKTVILDTNVILRYLLNDIEEQTLLAENIFKTRKFVIPIEVMAEVIYILTKFYKQPKNEAVDGILYFMGEMKYSDIYLETALKTYKSKNLDFVDCVLFAYGHNEYYEIFTFDKKLNKLLSGEL